MLIFDSCTPNVGPCSLLDSYIYSLQVVLKQLLWTSFFIILFYFYFLYVITVHIMLSIYMNISYLIIETCGFVNVNCHKQPTCSTPSRLGWTIIYTYSYKRRPPVQTAPCLALAPSAGGHGFFMLQTAAKYSKMFNGMKKVVI